MNLDDVLRRKAQEQSPPIPEEFSRRVEDTLLQLSPSRRPRHRWTSVTGILSAAAVAVLVFLPNSSAAMADTLGQLPVVGSLFQAVTFRTYDVNDETHQVSISVPHIVGSGDGAGVQEINETIQQYTDQLIAEFERDSRADGYFNLDVTWAVVTNTEHWFTLRVSSDRVMASGNHQEQHYHLDPMTGEQKTLSDLFPENFDYVSIINAELKDQMRARMDRDSREFYWLEDRSQSGCSYFESIDPEQDFYFDEQGCLVIPFDKYEVGPGSTGSPKFTLQSAELYRNLKYHP